jgi:hypothetical protein
MSDRAAYLIVLGIVAILVAVVVYEVMVWKECLHDHPWWDCLRIVS